MLYKDRKDIWRVECRFFKNYIRNHDLRTFYDLERNLAKEIECSFISARYVVPNTDSNKSRWPNIWFWESAKQTAKKALKYHGCDVLPETVHEAGRKRSLDAIGNMFAGLCISRAVLLGVPYNELMKIPELIESDMKELLKHNPEKLQKKYDEAYRRYFVDQT